VDHARVVVPVTRSLAAAVTDNSRVVVAVMLVLTVVVGAGVPLVEQSTSLDQFQSETDESEALDYADANFRSADGGGTVTQVVVQGENVLSRDALLATLDYQRAIRENATANESLASTDPTRSVATTVGTRAYADARLDDLDDRETELNETSDALRGALATLEADPNASVHAEFDAVDSNHPVDLDDRDYETFADAAATLRTDSANASARETAYRQGTRGVLADEYDALRADYAAIRDGVDPSLAAQRDAVAALNESELDATLEAVLDADDGASGVRSLLPTDHEPGTTEANATLVVAVHDTNESSFAAGNAPESLVDAKLAMQTIADDELAGRGNDATGGDDPAVRSALVFGSGVVAHETQASMTDSLLLVGPLALLFVVVVLVLAYRDLLDVALGIVGVALVLAWTFGVMGWAGIAFNQPFIIVVVLLIGLSIDYAIHVVMRYREERNAGDDARGDDHDRRGAPDAGGTADDHDRRGAPDAGAPRHAMRTALGSVGVALVLVTATTVIGFLSNLASPLDIFRQIGVVSAIGIVAALLVFGVLLPALKVELEAALESRGVDRDATAIGVDGGRVEAALAGVASLSRRAPVAVLVVALLVTAGGAYGATQVDTSFSESDFIAEDPADWLSELPEPFAPGEYRAQRAMDVLDDRFVRQDAEATVLVEGDVADPGTLDRLDAATANASTMTVVESYPNGDPAVRSPLTVMDSVAASNESFAETLAAADVDDDGDPDRNVSAVYDELYRVAPDDAATVLHRSDDGEYVALKATVSVAGDADGSTVTDRMRWIADDVAGDAGDVSATATGQVVINAITADQLLETVVQGLVVALLAALAFVAAAYRVTHGSATLGVVVLLPVAATVAWVLGSMAVLDVPFNIVTGLITSLTVGLGIDYSIHVGERFSQALSATGDLDAALEESVTGTGGALLSSAATTASGFGVLTVALLPFLQAFGVITALTIAFAFVASVFVLPSLLALWARWTGRADAPDGATQGTAASVPTVDGERTVSSAAPGTGDATPDASVASRTVSDAVVAPGRSLDVTVTVHATGERALLQEHAPGTVALQSAAPSPVRVVDADDGFYVLWDDANGDDDHRAWTLSYTVTVPDGVDDGDGLAFDGTVATSTHETAVGGDVDVQVLADVFQRVLERGTATTDDVHHAADQFESDALTDAEFQRLCRHWLDRDDDHGRALAGGDD